MVTKSNKEAACPSRRRSLWYVAAMMLFCLGVVLSVAGFLHARRGERQKLSEQFEAAAQDRAAAIRGQVDAHLLLLESLHALYETNAEVTREEFRTFTRPLLSYHPDIQALEWIPRVPDRQREAHEAAARQDGLESYQITERVVQGRMVADSRRDEYFPVYFVEPRKGNEIALGFDMASESRRLEAMGRARDTGKAAATGRITLVQETESQAGFLIFLPVYRSGAAVGTVEQRREHLRGFVLGVFRVGKMVEEAIAALVHVGIDVCVHDSTAGPEHLLDCYSSPPQARAAGDACNAGAGRPGQLVYRETFDVSGRLWFVVCIATPAFTAAHTTRYPWIVLAGGLLLTLLISAYSFSATRHAARLAQLVSELSRGNRALNEEVSERKRAEDEVRSLKTQIEFILGATKTGLDIIDAEFNIRYIDPAWQKVYGDHTGRKCYEYFMGRSEPCPGCGIPKALQTKAITVTEEVLVKENSRPVQVTTIPFRTDAGEWLAAEVNVDITNRKQAENALRRSEERFRNLVESVTDYIYTVQVEGGRVIKTIHGPGCVRVTGYAPEEYEASADTWFRMVPEEHRQAVLAQAERLTLGQECPPLEHRIIRKDGSVRWVRNTPVLVRDEQGRSVGYEGLIQDITDQKKMQEQLFHAQKMEAVGQLAGGVAHDFRNQLTVIKGFAEMLLRRSLVADRGREHIEEILKAVERSVALSNQLLGFSRKLTLQPELVHIDSLIGDMGKSLARVIGEDIHISLAPGAGESVIKVDPAQLQQAIVNLALNAADAMPKGGRLTIETSNVNLDESYVRQHAEVSPGPHVMVVVSDTGTGMDRKTLDRLFEPFFTTKPVGQGTGLGLSMVYGFVKQSGGSIAVYSELGRGTTFKIYLPAVAAPEHWAQPTVNSPSLSRGGGTILVVEDEEPIRKVMVQTLQECGYVVLEAPSGQEALSRLASGSSRIDLLVTDVVMPGMDGVDLAQHARAISPALRVLYVSGYTDKALVEHGVCINDVRLLIKPFGSQMLLEAVKSAIDNMGEPPRDEAQTPAATAV